MTWNDVFHWLPVVIVCFATAALILNFNTMPRPKWSIGFNSIVLIYGLIRCYFEYLA